MATGKDVLSIATKEIGVKEQPKDSNRVKYNTWFYGKEVSGSQYPWCMAFVQWCYRQAGISTSVGKTLKEGGTASCGTLLNWYKKNQPECIVKTPQPGDIIIYDFPGGAATDHTGLFESLSGKNVVSIDGNTGSGNEANGGAVMRRTRPVSYVVAYIRPREITQITTASEAIDKLHKLGVLNSPTYWKVTVKGGDVRYLDKLLIKAANRITRYGLRSSTANNGVDALVKAGVIDTPEYWAGLAEIVPNIGELLKALGGAAAVS